MLLKKQRPHPAAKRLTAPDVHAGKQPTAAAPTLSPEDLRINYQPSARTGAVIQCMRIKLNTQPNDKMLFEQLARVPVSADARTERRAVLDPAPVSALPPLSPDASPPPPTVSEYDLAPDEDLILEGHGERSRQPPFYENAVNADKMEGLDAAALAALVTPVIMRSTALHGQSWHGSLILMGCDTGPLAERLAPLIAQQVGFPVTVLGTPAPITVKKQPDGGYHAETLYTEEERAQPAIVTGPAYLFQCVGQAEETTCWLQNALDCLSPAEAEHLSNTPVFLSRAALHYMQYLDSAAPLANLVPWDGTIVPQLRELLRAVYLLLKNEQNPTAQKDLRSITLRSAQAQLQLLSLDIGMQKQRLLHQTSSALDFVGRSGLMRFTAGPEDRSQPSLPRLIPIGSTQALFVEFAADYAALPAAPPAPPTPQPRSFQPLLPSQKRPAKRNIMRPTLNPAKKLP